MGGPGEAGGRTDYRKDGTDIDTDRREPLIQEGEGIPLDEAVRDFVAAGEHLLEIQRQAEPYVCTVLKNVRVDNNLGNIVSRYKELIGS
jgi:hypothetical protein